MKIDNDQDLICEWSKKALKLSKESKISRKKINLNKLELKFKTDFNIDEYNSYTKQFITINKLIDDYDEIKSSNQINDFIISLFNYFGAFSLIIAFAIRLAITTYNINKIKTEA